MRGALFRFRAGLPPFLDRFRMRRWLSSRLFLGGGGPGCPFLVILLFLLLSGLDGTYGSVEGDGHGESALGLTREADSLLLGLFLGEMVSRSGLLSVSQYPTLLLLKSAAGSSLQAERQVVSRAAANDWVKMSSSLKASAWQMRASPLSQMLSIMVSMWEQETSSASWAALVRRGHSGGDSVNIQRTWWTFSKYRHARDLSLALASMDKT